MIRSFDPADMDRVLEIWLEASIKAHDFVAGEFWESKVPEMQEVYLPASETYVVEDEGAIKGFVSLYEDSLAAIFVSPGAQGEGLGRQLMAKAKEVRQSLTLTVYKENKNSTGFYERCGFKIVEEKTDDHTGHAELVMTFNL
ncbi:acetyltransferase [Desulfoluna limicola]|uniref:Acetyltransferase n=1 Tax=Desulfoluna limicola TaxID=2810562 RepID=A0ABM7PK36_9BACT|nr:N-acetyltransferase [Desulfoluna limicola]BCS97561.1 acetyltransferase [Desulfoluna limicola]